MIWLSIRKVFDIRLTLWLINRFVLTPTPATKEHGRIRIIYGVGSDTGYDEKLIESRGFSHIISKLFTDCDVFEPDPSLREDYGISEMD